MPSFKVKWTRFADGQLIQIWISAHDRDAVSRAAALIEAELVHSPELKGTLVGTDLYEFACPPLSVAYVIYPKLGLVRIVAVKRLDFSRNGTGSAA